MKTKKEIIASAKNTINMEADALLSLVNKIDTDFYEVVEFILESQGRVVVTGIGKSAIIAQKIVATMNSTGTPAVFMHAADAVHGDLGMIRQEDLVICISKSGNTPEIKVLAPLLKSRNKLVAMVGDTDSFLAKQADWVLNTSVEKEACPNNLAPTTSTTAQLAMGDALAVSLLDAKSFGKEDFARFHPGGSLGKRLYLKVGDVSVQHPKPLVSSDSSIKDVILAITKGRLGCVAVIETDGSILGIITDGDIRRMLEKYTDLAPITAKDVMHKQPKMIPFDSLATEALQEMRTNNINQLLVIQEGRYEGVIHLHDLLNEGIV